MSGNMKLDRKLLLRKLKPDRRLLLGKLKPDRENYFQES